MEKCVVCVLILAGLLGIEMCTSSSCFPGTRAVTWTLYEKVRKLTWNEASRFCKERGGYLPVTNTHITMASFQDVIWSWQSIEEKIWLGLHSSVSGEIPNVWDRDCCLLPASVQHWATDLGEPNYLGSQRCSRMNAKMPGGWLTTSCTKPKLVVCETDRGNCTFHALNDTTVSTPPDVSKAYVYDVSTCWSLCLELRHNGEECVAAVLELTAMCKLYVGGRLLAESDIATSSGPGSVLMLRRCFEEIIDSDQSFSGFSYDNGQSVPDPWSVTCSTVYTSGVDPRDFLPAGVEPGLVTTTTSLPTTTESATPKTTTASTRPSSSPQSASQGSSSTQAPTSPPPPQSSAISTAESSSPETAGSTTDMTASSTEVTTMTAESGTKGSQTTAPAPPASPSTTEAGTPQPRKYLCPCSCSYKYGAKSPPPLNLLAIPRNQTSRYRRTKTSAKTGQTSHVVVSMPWVVAVVSVFCWIVLRDLNRILARLCPSCGVQTNKVSIEP